MSLTRPVLLWGILLLTAGAALWLNRSLIDPLVLVRSAVEHANGFLSQESGREGGLPQALDALPDGRLSNLTADYRYTREEIEDAANELLQLQQSAPPEPVAGIRERIVYLVGRWIAVDDRQSTVRYSYRIQLVTGGTVVAREVSIENGRVTYGHASGLVVTLEPGQVKTVQRLVIKKESRNME